MKTLLLFLSVLLRASAPLRVIPAANDLDDLAIANAIDGEGIFEIQQREKLFVPFGEYPHPKGLQKFDRQSGELLATAFNSLPAKLGRIFTPGVPIYRGHPDVPGRADSDPAAPAMGWVQGVTVENDGVNFAVKWNPDGEAAIGNAHFRFYSPNWLLRNVKGGIQPVKLLSIGLTNNPRIPVPAIANDDDSTNPPDDMKLTALLRKLLGFAENDEPTPEQLDAKAAELEARLATAANDLATLTPKLSKAEADLVTVIAERDAARVELTAANDAATVARTGMINARIEPLVAATKVLPAEVETLRTELLAIENDADLDARFGALAKVAPKLKTASVTSGLGKEKSELKQAANDAAERSRQRQDAIAEELTAIETDRTLSGAAASAKYDRAFARAQAKHPTLFPTTTKTV